MSLDPAIFRALVAQGASPEMLLAVVEAAAEVDEARKAKKRADNAERQRRFKAKKVTQNNADNALPSVTERERRLAPPNDIYSNPPVTPPVEAKASTAPRGKNRNRDGDRLSDDWQPKPLTGATAEMVGAWPAGMLERQLAQFRDHYAKTPGSKGKSLDWDASLRTWLRNADQWMGERNGRSSANGVGRMGGPGPSPLLQIRQAAAAAVARNHVGDG